MRSVNIRLIVICCLSLLRALISPRCPSAIQLINLRFLTARNPVRIGVDRDLYLGLIPAIGDEPVTLQRLMGVPLQEATAAGALMGTKTILNELLAYLQMSQMKPGALSPKSMLIMTYAMCGFANPGSLGIMIGGMGTMAPARRDEIVSLGLRSIIAGTLATCMTGAVVGIIAG